MLNHMSYLNKKVTICERPDLLGKDFVLADYNQEADACKVCFALLFAFNERNRREEDRRPEVSPGLSVKVFYIAFAIVAMWTLIGVLIYGMVKYVF